MGRRAPWIAPLRRELAFRWRHNRRGLLISVAIVVTGGAGAALLMVHGQFMTLQKEQQLQLRTDEGLLELRVNQHRVTVLDWGHWDTLHAFAGGKSPDFVARELVPSFIAADRQFMLVFDPSGKQLAEWPRLPNEALRRCLLERLQLLQPLTSKARPDQAFGLYCRAGGRVLLGAATGIRPSSGALPERGWVMHLSALERPSYNAALNGEFRRINAALGFGGLGSAGERLAVGGISELEPPGHGWQLAYARQPLQKLLMAVQLSLLPWLLITLPLVALLPLLVVISRQQRLPKLVRAGQERRIQRRRRRRIGRQLLGRRQFMLALERSGGAAGGGWLAGLRLESQSPSSEQVIDQLTTGLRDVLPGSLMALIDNSTLLLASGAETGLQEAGAVLGALECLLQGLGQTLPEGAGLRCSGLVQAITGADRQAQAQHLLQILGGENISEGLRLLDPVQSRAQAQPQLPSPPGGAGSGRDDLPAGSTSLEPVLRLTDGQPQLVHRQLVFHPEAGQGGWSPRSALDLHLQREAIAWLQVHRHPAEDLAVVQSLQSLADSSLALLDPMLRQHLILCIEEQDLAGVDDGPTLERLQTLSRLGLRFAVHDFGRAALPLETIGRLGPSHIQLDPELSRRLHDSNTTLMVEFLLAYCRYKTCRLVMPGIEDSRQLRYWQRLGVELFQGPGLALSTSR